MLVATKDKTNDEQQFSGLKALATAAGLDSQPFIELTVLLDERRQVNAKVNKLEEQLQVLFADFQHRATELIRVFFEQGEKKLAETEETEPILFTKLGLPNYLLYPIALMQAHTLSDKAVFKTLLLELPGKKLHGANKAATAARMLRRARGLLSTANGKRRSRFVANLLNYLKNELAMGNDEVETVFRELSNVYTKYTGSGVATGILLQEAGY